MRLILDEMYSAALAVALGAVGVDASTAVQLGLGGRSDPELFEAAIAADCAVLTENVADVARLCADRLSADRHHHGVLIALSSRFSRLPTGTGSLVAAIAAVVDEDLRDRLVYLDAAVHR